MLPTSDADEGLKNLPLEVTTMLLHQTLKGLSASQGTISLSRYYRPLKVLSSSLGGLYFKLFTLIDDCTRHDKKSCCSAGLRPL